MCTRDRLRLTRTEETVAAVNYYRFGPSRAVASTTTTTCKLVSDAQSSRNAHVSRRPGIGIGRRRRGYPSRGRPTVGVACTRSGVEERRNRLSAWRACPAVPPLIDIRLSRHRIAQTRKRTEVGASEPATAGLHDTTTPPQRHETPMSYDANAQRCTVRPT